METFILSLIFWTILAILVAYEGRDRQIGFSKALILSIFLSPVVGFAFTAISKTDDEMNFQRELKNLAEEQHKLLKSISEKMDSVEKNNL